MVCQVYHIQAISTDPLFSWGATGHDRGLRGPWVRGARDPMN